MEKFLLPSIFKVEEMDKPDAARIIIEPCYHGYGTTLGNALRRVLLSSLPGAAVTAVKIKGATHEFTTLDHVQEDIVELILNLKKLRLRVFSSEEVKLTLSAKGEGEVTAAQIETTSDVEIVNSDLHLATLTHKDARLEMEIFVSQGRGYVPVEEKEKIKLELGTVAIDSIFNPVLHVGYKVDFVRVGEITNFERLTLDIETDGTITPLNALLQGTKILQDHIDLIMQGFSGETREIEEIAKEPEEAVEETKEEVEEKEEEKPKKRGRKPSTSTKKKK
ncbi:MAG: DNA-directed RNA polymerase subunit alpha [Candidatus Magasanikbacteria bacterium GW2011_GWC2_40_17]|uniref:DNA-directed RNA polymerase subunit alpha n=1 Tax=Candidatus Magasanikbacteria bacterium GW2011_GWA2_42_32 TaxID=1619039 RepID=A0A0G1CFX8_9BACT|nr:MAG: DNA-directed RNA polymerase subunit alpha [Candidatus Magasanikbacteria bacterium GW2011_GWC2_40_17]KKS57471.1 MAG: DNA-directed RNA polymerase subunit alpha [Candidatus Magasanikbacteria bacterium GW2011_GWA2_42_32]OGH85188.1 MAG: DNA-directed RNA polymerase subunit alpha [Candidatus Magasanikbacteria bacterium RIFOXYB2_FULL_38_10]